MNQATKYPLLSSVELCDYTTLHYTTPHHNMYFPPTDIDECATSNGGCDQTCANTPAGSYTCSCNAGYTLDADLHTCNGKYEGQVSLTIMYIIY